MRAQEDEIVANLAGGRAIILVANDAIILSAIDHPIESKSVPPRVAAVDSRHVAIFFGASEWQVPAQPKPIRLDRDIPHLVPLDPRMATGEAEQDLEQIGIAFLEKLRPLVSQLHHPIDLKPDEPLFQIILIGYAPQYYGPEVWLIDYQVEQSAVGANGSDFWQTRLLRPRFTQLYPPEKHQPKTLIEVRVPANLPDIPLLGLIQQNAPAIARLRSGDQHVSRVVELIQRGESQKADPEAAADFLRAALPIVAGDAHFILGTMTENGGFQWIVPPDEPREKEKTAEDKNRPADAPSLMRKPKP